MVADTEAFDDATNSETQFIIQCPVLLTERLVMRPPHEDDISDLAVLANDHAVASMLTALPHPYGQREARAFVERCAQAEIGAAYALTLSETGTFIGCASLMETSVGPALGYWVGKPYQGNGYATEAAHALVDLAFRATMIDTLHVSCRVINTGSRRVIQKCGFQYAGQGMSQSQVSGQVPVERYRLDRKTWISLRSWPRAD